MTYKTDDLRIKNITEVIPPLELHNKFPITPTIAKSVQDTRNDVHKILHGLDDRILLVIGPCSIHDPKAAIEYAQKLQTQIIKYKKDLVIIMRVYFEKPRTTLGWKGLINDPDLDETFKVNKGLSSARKLLLDINSLGVPTATEFLDLISPQYVADLISWGAIGARTTESQGHRELSSGISCPVGFKNATDGGVKVAVDAIRAANSPHIFMSLTKEGKSAIFRTTGNNDCHVILRGGNDSPNYNEDSIASTVKELQASNSLNKVMIDCSHANSFKQYKKQIDVAKYTSKQISKGNFNIMGAMVESNLVGGNQKLDTSKSLIYGKSITDACLGWEDSLDVISIFANGVRERRKI